MKQNICRCTDLYEISWNITPRYRYWSDTNCNSSFSVLNLNFICCLLGVHILYKESNWYECRSHIHTRMFLYVKLRCYHVLDRWFHLVEICTVKCLCLQDQTLFANQYYDTKQKDIVKCCLVWFSACSFCMCSLIWGNSLIIQFFQGMKNHSLSIRGYQIPIEVIKIQ